MASLDRAKYMSLDETRQLRTVTEARAITDLKAGRVGGVTAWALVDFALLTGLRVAEIANLTVGDTDVKHSSLKVTRLRKKHKQPETLAIGEELTRHLKEYMFWREVVGYPVDAASPLFYGARGPLTAQGLQRIWKTAIRRTGLPAELSIHSARHTLAVHLLRKTGNLRQVQKQHGHASPATTANMYADISFADMQNGVGDIYGVHS